MRDDLRAAWEAAEAEVRRRRYLAYSLGYEALTPEMEALVARHQRHGPSCASQTGHVERVPCAIWGWVGIAAARATRCWRRLQRSAGASAP